MLAEQTREQQDKGKIVSSLKFLVRDSVAEGVEKVSLKFLFDEITALCSYKLDQQQIELIIEPCEAFSDAV